jgi:hypothetical protein
MFAFTSPNYLVNSWLTSKVNANAKMVLFKRGLNIIRMSDGTIRMIMVK